MKKLIGVLALIALLIACGGDKQEAIKKQIKQKRSQVARLEKQMRELELKLTDTLEQTASIPVQLKTMEGETFDHFIIVYASVKAEDYAFISPEMGGQIKKIFVDEGDRVNKGDLLVSVNTETTQNQIQQLEATRDLASITFKKQEALWNQGIGSEIQYLQAKTNLESLEAQLKTLKSQVRLNEVRAPFSGYVNKIFQKEGELASQMTPLVEMVNLNNLSIVANIPEVYISSLHIGQKVEVTFESIPGLARYPKISRISNVINPQSRTFEIELKMDNPGEKIKPNMISTISINDYSKENAFVIPSIIIKQDITGKYVYKAIEKNTQTIAKKVYVQTGLSYNENTLVTKGLNKGDKVIVVGYSQVSNGALVEEK